MPRLTDEHKTFIIQRLAMYGTPSQIAEAVKEEFGVTIDRQLVRFYNPTQVQPAKKWTAIFEATRASFLESLLLIAAKLPPGLPDQLLKLRANLCHLMGEGWLGVFPEREIMRVGANGAFAVARGGREAAFLTQVRGQVLRHSESVASSACRS